MSAESRRLSAFAFESKSHPCNVLRRLDDQRRRGQLCDVTVAVGGLSFGAHGSVLASCSQYFASRISNQTWQGAVITLPQEVMAAGFEPLLNFAYTSKLLFGKDNVLDVRNAASVLGFRDLDEACFDFLLPKLFASGARGFAPLPRKLCCKKKGKRQRSKAEDSVNHEYSPAEENEAKPASRSSSDQEVGSANDESTKREMEPETAAATSPSVAEKQAGGSDAFALKTPKYRKFQLACGKEACGPGKSLRLPAEETRPLRRPSCSGGCRSRDDAEAAKGEPGEGAGTDSQDVDKGVSSETRKDDKVQRETDESNGRRDGKERGMGAVAVGLSGDREPVPGERSLGLMLHHHPQEAFVDGYVCKGSPGQERSVAEATVDKEAGDCAACGHLQTVERERSEVSASEIPTERGGGYDKRGLEIEEELNTERVMGSDKRSGAEMEVARHLANELGSIVLRCPPLPCRQADGGSASETGDEVARDPSLDWLGRRVVLGSPPAGSSCLFLQGLSPSRREWKAAGEPSRPPPCGSPLRLRENGDSETETEGDDSSPSDKARHVKLPFSADWVMDLSKNEFQQLVKQQSLTREQLNFVHGMRRRSKNRIAAQRCRKRKLDCIYNLECEINKLRAEKQRLLAEKGRLSQMQLKERHTVSALCQRLCSEARLQPEQLQVLAKYSSPDCPLSCLIPRGDST